MGRFRDGIRPLSETAVEPGLRQYARDVSQRFLGLAGVLPLGAAVVAIGLRVAAARNLVRFQGDIHGAVHGGETDVDHVGELAGKLGRAGLLGAVLQVVALVVMAWVRVA